MTKIKYNEDILNNYISRDNVTFIEAYYNKDLIKFDSLSEFNSCCYIKFICKCNSEYIKCFRNVLNTGFMCEMCFKKDLVQRKKKIYLEKYGVENPNQSKEIIEKRKKTNLQRYGVEHSLQNKEVREKSKKTNLKRYGVEYITQSKEIQKKVRKTNLEKFGVEHILQNKEFREQIKKTNLEKYGVECTLQNKEVKDKIKQTNLIKYGVENPSQNKEIKEKKKTTLLKNYGVEHPSQAKEIQEKTQKNAKKYKKYIFPSGTIRNVQGYEHFALDELIKSYSEEQIKTDRKDIPRIKYLVDNKTRYYFPDIFIPHENYIIEVKSTLTYKSKGDSIKEKTDATKALGYKYEIWIYDSKGNKQII